MKLSTQFIQHGSGTKKAREHSGQVYISTKGVTGIVCAYKNQHDWCMYWVDTRKLYHYTTQVTQFLSGRASLSPENIGDKTYDITDDIELAILKMAKRETDASAKRRTVLELGEDKCRLIGNRVSEDTVALYKNLVEEVKRFGFNVVEYTLAGEKKVALTPPQGLNL